MGNWNSAKEGLASGLNAARSKWQNSPNTAPDYVVQRSGAAYFLLPPDTSYTPSEEDYNATDWNVGTGTPPLG